MASIIHYLLYTSKSAGLKHSRMTKRKKGGTDDYMLDGMTNIGRSKREKFNWFNSEHQHRWSLSEISGPSLAWGFCSWVSPLFQTVEQMTLHVGITLCRVVCSLCSVSAEDVSVLVVCASGWNPLMPPCLNIPEKLLEEERGVERGKVKGYRETRGEK